LSFQPSGIDDFCCFILFHFILPFSWGLPLSVSQAGLDLLGSSYPSVSASQVAGITDACHQAPAFHF
jgi:hypothetical protein